ncbi:MAG: hypothetical protein ACRCTZ_20695 [Sarcina sp.]
MKNQAMMNSLNTINNALEAVETASIRYIKEFVKKYTTLCNVMGNDWIIYVYFTDNADEVKLNKLSIVDDTVFVTLYNTIDGESETIELINLDTLQLLHLVKELDAYLLAMKVNKRMVK